MAPMINTESLTNLLRFSSNRVPRRKICCSFHPDMDRRRWPFLGAYLHSDRGIDIVGLFCHPGNSLDAEKD